MPSPPHVASLHAYPIKSCQGIDLDEAVVHRRGFELDRRFMVIDEQGGFRSQRDDPYLARVSVSVNSGALTVAAPDHGTCSIDLATAADGASVQSTVWRHTGASVDQGTEVAAFFSELLGSASRLVYMPDDVRRRVNPAYAASPVDIVGFADGYPLLLTTTASLRALQAQMDEPTPMSRFRPNIVIESDEPWLEDSWRTIDVGQTRLTFTRPCIRCVITTTDQRTGERFREPLRALAKLRRTSDGVTFGSYFVPVTIGTQVRCGDVLST